MKRFLLNVNRLALNLIALLMALPMTAQTVGEAFYVYRNDGQFNAFLREEVDSITYSCYDADSIQYGEVVTQLVHTKDSIYYIPIAAIDSVGFVQVETIYKENIIQLGNLRDYVVHTNGMTIDFSKSLPESMKPNVGDILLFESFEEPFPEGVAGCVRSVESAEYITVSCDSVGLADIYEQNVECFSFELDDVGNAAKGLARQKSNGWSIPISLGAEVLGAGASVEGTITLKGTGKCIKKIVPGEPVYFDANLKFNITKEASAKFSASVNAEKVFKIEKRSIPLPYGMFVNIEYGPFVDVSVSGSVESRFSASASHTIGFKYENGRGECYHYSKDEGSDSEMSLNGSASLFIGGELDVKLGAVGNIARMGGTLKFGPFVTGDYTTKITGEDLASEYVVNRDSKMMVCGRTELKMSAGLYIELLGIEVAKTEASISPISWDFLKRERYFFPLFSMPKYEKGKALSDAIVQTTVSRDLISPVAIGLALYDKNGNRIVDKYADELYQYGNDNMTFCPYTAVFSDLPIGTYTCSPVLRHNGREIVAAPSVQIGKDIVVTTGEASEIAITGGIVMGYVGGDDYTTEEYGICYAQAGGDDWTFVKGSDRNVMGIYSVALNDLQADTEYKYCAYVLMDDEYLYGEQESFKTKKMPTGSTEIGNIVYHEMSYDVTIIGKLEDIESDNFEYGICYYKRDYNGIIDGEEYHYVQGNNLSNGIFSVTISNLAYSDRYEYMSYVLIDGEYYYGDKIDKLVESYTSIVIGGLTITYGARGQNISNLRVSVGGVAKYMTYWGMDSKGEKKWSVTYTEADLKGLPECTDVSVAFSGYFETKYLSNEKFCYCHTFCYGYDEETGERYIRNEGYFHD